MLNYLSNVVCLSLNEPHFPAAMFLQAPKLGIYLYEPILVGLMKLPFLLAHFSWCINLVVNHYGKSTESEINASGALKDSSSKIFRGTIDFKTGSSDSVGNEKESVLMLGDGVINKTVPLILCAEENVVGNHGATIGELDDETLFYFESRGIGKAEAENILARAAIERLARETGDEETEKLIIKILDEDL